MPNRPLSRTAWLFLGICFLLSARLFANDPDSLINVYNRSVDPNKRAEVAYQILARTIRTNPSLATPFLLKSLGDSSSLDKNNLANCYKALSITFFYKGSYDTAISFSNHALSLFTALKKDSEVEKVLKNRALSLSSKGLYTDAITDYLRALEFTKKVGDTLQIAGTLNDIGNTYARMKNFDEALKFQQEALAYCRRREVSPVLGNILNSVGFIYDVGGINSDSAIFYYNESLKVKEQYGNIYSIINTKNNLCACYNLDKRLSEFLKCFHELLPLQKQVSDLAGITRSYINLTNGYRIAKQYSKALDYQRLAVQSGKAVGDPELMTEVYDKSAKLFKERGMFKDALDAYERHLTLKDSVFYAKRNEVAQELAAKYEFEKKNREIAEAAGRLATAENERLLGEFKLRSRNYWIVGLSMVLLLGVMVSMVFTQRLRHRKEAEKSAAVLAERDRGVKAIIDAQEDERTRIARELHDGIGNNLLALQLQLRTSGQSSDPVASRLSEIMDNVRTVSHEMMPKVLQEFGCVPAIRDMLERMLGISGIRYSFETHNTDNRKYDQRIETAIYRITQELINNVVKHSGADFVSVQLIETDSTLVLFVEDNGKGISATKGHDGIGMTNIRTRLNAINGDMDISEGKESGTVASIRIPLR